MKKTKLFSMDEWAQVLESVSPKNSWGKRKTVRLTEQYLTG